MAPEPDVVQLTVPADPRFLEVAIASIEALAVRAGIDRAQVEALHGDVQALLGARLDHAPAGEPVVLRYEVGEGFLGVRLVERTAKERGATS